MILISLTGVCSVKGVNRGGEGVYLELASQTQAVNTRLGTVFTNHEGGVSPQIALASQAWALIRDREQFLLTTKVRCRTGRRIAADKYWQARRDG